MRLLLLGGLILVGASSLGAQRSRCADTPIDSSNTAAPIHQACHVDREARARQPMPRIDWTPAASDVRHGACFRAEFRFVVDTLGRPELGTITLVSQNNPGFADAVRASIAELRYTPARLGPRPVRQVVVHKESAGIRVAVRAAGAGSGSLDRPPRC